MIKKSISVVVPVYNASHTIERLIISLDETLQMFQSYDIILVNDFSCDHSKDVILSAMDRYPHVKFVDLSENVGQQRAIFIGLEHTQGDYIVIMDDDLETNAQDILKMYYEIEKGYDVVYALNENDKGKQTHRKLGGVLRDVLFKVLTRIPSDTKVCSFRMMKRHVIDEVIKSKKSFVYISMEILSYTQNIQNIYVAYNKNKDSNYTFIKLVSLYTNIFIHYSFLSVLITKNYQTPKYTITGGQQ